MFFLGMGAFLESLHAFKVGFYLDSDRKIRREMWTLSHAHDTLFALIQIGFAAGLMHLGKWTAGRLKLVSFFMLDAALLIPLGFFLGGIAPSEGDPWIGILFVPLGAILLFIAVVLIIFGVFRERDDTGSQTRGDSPSGSELPC